MSGNQRVYTRPDGEPMSGDERRRARALYLRRKRKRRQIIIYTVLLVAFAGVGIALSLTVFFHIDKVQIENSAIYTDEEITAAAKIEMGKNLFLFDSEMAVSNVQTTLPYIGKLTVKRRLPGTLVLIVEETAERAAIPFNDAYALINEDGKVLSTSSITPADNSAVINDVEILEATPGKTIVLSQEEALESIKSILKALDEYSFDGITEMCVSDSLSLRLVYDNRLTLRLGPAADMQRKLRLAAECIEKENQRNPQLRGVINLTIDGRAYVGPEETTVNTAESTTASPEQQITSTTVPAA
ncbi:MAG: FtsQ-type POTRA domain-containing protein [Clostridiales bacterium]|nr:FtsQ-type POTRA domain-containing protein [Clostridiales bacterium]